MISHDGIVLSDNPVSISNQLISSDGGGSEQALRPVPFLLSVRSIKALVSEKVRSVISLLTAIGPIPAFVSESVRPREPFLGPIGSVVALVSEKIRPVIPAFLSVGSENAAVTEDILAAETGLLALRIKKVVTHCVILRFFIFCSSGCASATRLIVSLIHIPGGITAIAIPPRDHTSYHRELLRLWPRLS